MTCLCLSVFVSNTSISLGYTQLDEKLINQHPNHDINFTIIQAYDIQEFWSILLTQPTEIMINLVQIEGNINGNCIIPQLSAYIQPVLYTYQNIKLFHYKITSNFRFIPNEIKYIKNAYKIITKGTYRKSRSGDVLSYFDIKLKYKNKHLLIEDRHYVPLPVTKRIGFKSVLEELLLILRGQTNSKILEAKKCFIWKPNTSRQALDKLGLTYYQEGTMGPTYGWNYRGYNSNYDEALRDTQPIDGVDQYLNLINNLVLDPNSRRHIILNWNPSTLSQSPLPPCLLYHQFYIRTEIDQRTGKQIKLLSIFSLNRSNDFSCAGNWNQIFSTLLCQITAIIIGAKFEAAHNQYIDTHIYESNKQQTLHTQCTRIPIVANEPYYVTNINQISQKFPITRDQLNEYLNQVSTDNFILYDYNPEPGIKYELMV